MILGTIASVTENGVTLILDGETEPTSKEYMIIDSYAPSVGDRVLVEEISNTYVVVGKVSKTSKPVPSAKKETKSAYTTITFYNTTYTGSYEFSSSFEKVYYASVVACSTVVEAFVTDFTTNKITYTLKQPSAANRTVKVCFLLRGE